MRRIRKKYAGVRRRGECSFEINYYVNRQRKTETIKAHSEGEAYAVKLQRITQFSGLKDSSEQVIPDDVTLEGAFNRYEDTERFLKSCTVQRSRCVYNHFLDFLKVSYPNLKFVHQVSGDVGNAYKNCLLSKPDKTASGINWDITKLRAIFACYVRYKFIKENPFKKVEKIPRRLAKEKEKYLPTDLDVAKIRQGIQGHPDYAEITEFILRTGRRIDETANYKRTDLVVDELGEIIALRIRREITKAQFESSELLLDDSLREVIKKAVAKNADSQYLFTNRWGRQIWSNTYRDFLKTLCRNLGIKGNITPHCFRYYVVNKLTESGIKLKDAMAITGHVDIQSFLHYQKSTREGQLKALKITLS